MVNDTVCSPVCLRSYLLSFIDISVQAPGSRSQQRGPEGPATLPACPPPPRSALSRASSEHPGFGLRRRRQQHHFHPNTVPRRRRSSQVPPTPTGVLRSEGTPRAAGAPAPARSARHPQTGEPNRGCPTHTHAYSQYGTGAELGQDCERKPPRRAGVWVRNRGNASSPGYKQPVVLYRRSSTLLVPLYPSRAKSEILSFLSVQTRREGSATVVAAARERL